jgi:hypothetical protein
MICTKEDFFLHSNLNLNQVVLLILNFARQEIIPRECSVHLPIFCAYRIQEEVYWLGIFIQRKVELLILLLITGLFFWCFFDTFYLFGQYLKKKDGINDTVCDHGFVFIWKLLFLFIVGNNSLDIIYLFILIYYR